MNCNEAERLFDAHLDGQLSGSLRLEFEAHRLRCRRCTQTLSLLESCTRVIASDSRIPALSDSFTDRVMSRVRQTRMTRRLRLNRKTIAASVVLQAAAVLLFALYLRPQAPVPHPADQPLPEWLSSGLRTPGESRSEDAQVVAALGKGLLATLHGEQPILSGVSGLSRLFELEAPGALARQSIDITASDPLTGLFRAILGPVVPQSDAGGTDFDFSL